MADRTINRGSEAGGHTVVPQETSDLICTLLGGYDQKDALAYYDIARMFTFYYLIYGSREKTQKFHHETASNPLNLGIRYVIEQVCPNLMSTLFLRFGRCFRRLVRILFLLLYKLLGCSF